MSLLADQIAESITALTPLPIAGTTLTLAQAYHLQREVAAKVSPRGFAGIKAGVTSTALQEMFKIDFALLGRLYESGELAQGDVLPALKGRRIECEIACQCDSNGTVTAIAPAIEFACVRFPDPASATAPNLVAANVAAEKFLVGDMQTYDTNMDSIGLKLYRDDELVNEAVINESLGGPVAAARWIMAEARERDFDINPTNFLMTGACGEVIAAVPGQYRADYGPLGTLLFAIDA